MSSLRRHVCEAILALFRIRYCQAAVLLWFAILVVCFCRQMFCYLLYILTDMLDRMELFPVYARRKTGDTTKLDLCDPLLRYRGGHAGSVAPRITVIKIACPVIGGSGPRVLQG